MPQLAPQSVSNEISLAELMSIVVVNEECNTAPPGVLLGDVSDDEGEWNAAAKATTASTSNI